MDANRERVTDEDLRTLRAIEVYRQVWGYSPTIRKLVDLLGKGSTSVVHLHLLRLERCGLIECPGERGCRRRYNLAVLTQAGELALRRRPDLRFALSASGARPAERMAGAAARES